ncbi:FeoA family protein [Roseateles oligotrophus]|uniref:Ferrous iron transport protein A n=1 Tax=Roseateles oligotrophus TaxID=1769250 RepID=A0ABT2YLH5_9BURK|nr:FeoA family protein [Roseateles oligotrophus]MCV2370924.1 ferrous iron transport protein A [Roseateles oligotrophus]
MTSASPDSLAMAAIGAPMNVVGVSSPNYAPEWAEWLEELGFLPGEAVRVMARGQPGADPLVVRIGQSTFALRRAEAACICVKAAAPDQGAIDA